jgi:flagellar protein FliJ
MKRFQFRLDKVLELRKISEEQAQRRMADAERARTLQEQVLLEAENASLGQESAVRKQLSAGFKAGEALLGHRYAIKLKRDVREEGDKLVRVVEVVSDRRKELSEAARQKKSLEILRDKRKEEYLVEELRIEQNVLDDEAAQRLYRVKDVHAGR